MTGDLARSTVEALEELDSRGPCSCTATARCSELEGPPDPHPGPEPTSGQRPPTRKAAS